MIPSKGVDAGAGSTVDKRMSFTQVHDPERKPSPGDLVLLSHEGLLLVVGDKASAPSLPTFGSLDEATRSLLFREQARSVQSSTLLLGELEGVTVWAALAPSAAEAPGGTVWRELRPLLALLSPGLAQAVACARELLWWERRHRFCGCCGAPAHDSPRERARVCTRCGETSYPVIAPAVIVAILRGDEILLAHNRNFRPGLHSLIAGFVDPGETLEQCVAREAFEETGLRVHKARYVTSQPWPYPASLMLGFVAELREGDIKVDGVEIEGAAWFRRDALPEIPIPGTVARRIIDAWLNREL